MAKRKRRVIQIGSPLFSVTLLVAALEALTRGDLMYGLAIMFEGAIMGIGMLLSFIPFFNVYVFMNSRAFIADMFASWDLTGGLGSAIVYALGAIPMFLITLVIDGIVIFALFSYFGGNKQSISKIPRTIQNYFR